MGAGRQVKGRLCLAFAKVMVLVVRRNRDARRGQVCIDDDVVMTRNFVDPLTGRIYDQALGQHLNGERAFDLGSFHRVGKRDGPSLGDGYFDRIGYGRVVWVVASVGEREPERVLPSRKIKDGLCLAFVEVSVLIVRGNGAARLGQVRVDNDVVVTSTFVDSLAGRLHT